jgi:hypothetical protein
MLDLRYKCAKRSFAKERAVVLEDRELLYEGCRSPSGQHSANPSARISGRLTLGRRRELSSQKSGELSLITFTLDNGDSIIHLQECK